jgi:hypothetical protein
MYSPLIWRDCTQAEVFSLNNMLVALLLLLTVRYYRRASLRTANHGALIIGIPLLTKPLG